MKTEPTLHLENPENMHLNKDENCMEVDAFFERVGVIDDIDTVLKLIDDADIDVDTKTLLREDLEGDDTAYFLAYGSSQAALKKLIDFHGWDKFHIVTSTETDDGEGLQYDNCLRTVNRINFYIAKGDTNDELYAVEEF